jgi:hypothetical protein
VRAARVRLGGGAGATARRAHAGSNEGAGTGDGAAQIRALVVANGRFWVGVAPVARRELARWRELASRIEDGALRELALVKLRDEAFNAEVAATLATLAPRPRRAAVVKAVVALEVLFDYLDGRTEALFDEPPGSFLRGGGEPPASRGHAHPDPHDAFEEGRRLSASLTAVISGKAPDLGGADSEYLGALSSYAHEHASALPGFAGVMPAALAAASRCADAQLRLHAGATLGDGQLVLWAQEACKGSGLGWREYVGGSASSVLAMHALIATAARGPVSEAEAQALDAAYLTIGAVITTLDSLVDASEDREAQQTGYIRLYEGRAEIQQRLLALIGEALLRAGHAPDSAYHAMTLAGVAAYYTTHPHAADTENREVAGAVRARLAPAIWPALLVLATWRAAKRGRGAFSAMAHAGGANGRPRTSQRGRGRA